MGQNFLFVLVDPSIRFSSSFFLFTMGPPLNDEVTLCWRSKTYGHFATFVVVVAVVVVVVVVVVVCC